MKLSKQMWLVVAIILVGTAAAGLILKTDKPMAEAGHGEHAEEADAKDEHADHEGEHEDEHGHAAMVTESVKGPHGGKLFKDGDYTVEVTIFEQDQPPQFRLYTYLNGLPPCGPLTLSVTIAACPCSSSCSPS